MWQGNMIDKYIWRMNSRRFRLKVSDNVEGTLCGLTWFSAGSHCFQFLKVVIFGETPWSDLQWRVFHWYVAFFVEGNLPTTSLASIKAEPLITSHVDLAISIIKAEPYTFEAIAPLPQCVHTESKGIECSNVKHLQKNVSTIESLRSVIFVDVNTRVVVIQKISVCEVTLFERHLTKCCHEKTTSIKI